jgi:hypothetical protein
VATIVNDGSVGWVARVPGLKEGRSFMAIGGCDQLDA